MTSNPVSNADEILNLKLILDAWILAQGEFKDKLDNAIEEIITLKTLFPLSKEIEECAKQETIIANIIAKKKTEEDRIKAL